MRASKVALRLVVCAVFPATALSSLGCAPKAPQATPSASSDAVPESGTESGTGPGTGPGADPGAGAGAVARDACADSPDIDPAMCRIDRLGDASMGWLVEGMAIDDLIARLGPPSGRDEPYEEGATGTTVFGMRWSEPPVDVRASYCIGSEALCVEGFTVGEGFTEQTARGIGVGSSEAEVLDAYADCIDPDGTEAGVRVTAGSVYGGMFFRIVDGRVASIYVGPGAE